MKSLHKFCVLLLLAPFSAAQPQSQATVQLTLTFEAATQAAANRKRDEWLLDFAAAQRVPIDIVQRDAQGVPVLNAQGRQQVDTMKLPELRLRARQILHNMVRNYRVEEAGKAALAAKSVSEDAAGVP
jgi:hypothetical protein